jgi:hypothetical protein
MTRREQFKQGRATALTLVTTVERRRLDNAAHTVTCRLSCDQQTLSAVELKPIPSRHTH